MNNSNQIDFWDIIEPIWNDPQINSELPEIYLKRFEELNKLQKVIFPTYLLNADVRNGGFHQCFWNTTGIYAPEAILGFQELGLSETSEIVQKAIDVFGDVFPREVDKRREFLDSFQGETRKEYDPFYSFDDEFYQSFVLDGVSTMENDKFGVAIEEFARKFLA